MCGNYQFLKIVIYMGVIKYAFTSKFKSLGNYWS